MRPAPLDLLRAVLLFTSLGAGATWVIWRHRPAWVQRVDGAVLESRFGDLKTIDAQMRAALGTGGALSAEEHARRLEQATRGMHRKDRFDELRLGALETLIGAAEARGADAAELLSLRDSLHAFHPKIVENEYARSRLLRELGRTDEADALVAKVLSVAGHEPELQRRRLADLARDRDVPGLVEAAAAMGFRNGPFAPPDDARFELRLANGQGGSNWTETYAVSPTPWGSAGRFVLEADRAEGAGDISQLRIDLPPGTPLWIQLLGITTDTRAVETGTISVQGANQLTGGSGLRFAANGGGDPYLTLSLPAPLAGERIALELLVLSPAPNEVAALMSDPAVGPALERALDGRPAWLRAALGVQP